MNGPVNASPLPAAGPAATSDTACGQRPASDAGVGRLEFAFQRLLRERIDTRFEPGAGRHDALPATGCASICDAGSGPPSPCDLRNLVGERRFGGNFGGNCEAEETAATAGSTGSTGDRSGASGRRSTEESADDPSASNRPEPACNDAPYGPGPAVRWPGMLDAVAPSAWTCKGATDQREMGATRAALAASLLNPVSTPESRAGAAWEVSLPLAFGAAIELHATRPPASAGATAWNLGIRSGTRDLTPALVRTASRLSERLEARSVSAHVRIEQDDRKAEP